MSRSPHTLENHGEISAQCNHVKWCKHILVSQSNAALLVKISSRQTRFPKLTVLSHSCSWLDVLLLLLIRFFERIGLYTAHALFYTVILSQTNTAKHGWRKLMTCLLKSLFFIPLPVTVTVHVGFMHCFEFLKYKLLSCLWPFILAIQHNLLFTLRKSVRTLHLDIIMLHLQNCNTLTAN